MKIEKVIVVSDDQQYFELDIYHDGKWVRTERLARIQYATPPRRRRGQQ